MSTLVGYCGHYFRGGRAFNFCYNYNISMNNSNLIIRESRIFFEERVSFRREFYLKMGVDKMIIKFNNFSWNAACESWENA